MNFEIELLRALVSIVDLGSFSRAASALHRTQAAVSLQMQRLENAAGVALFRREGRRRVLTHQGELMLSHARRILAAHDQAVAAMDQAASVGLLRLGASQGLADSALPGLLRRLRQDYPRVRLEVRVASSERLLEWFSAGELDLSLSVSMGGNADGDLLSTQDVEWVVPAYWQGAGSDPIPLALFAGTCGFKDLALRSLEEVGLPWYVSFSADSLHALLEAVAAGVGITARTRSAVGDGMRVATAGDGLPSLPGVDLRLQHNPRSALATQLCQSIRGLGLTPV
ncbi:MAG: LysR substrate-binding domain-containing protein [Gammaproteobacteria bacterium]